MVTRGTTPLAALALLAASGLVGCTYCTFWDMEDNRPVSKEQAYKLFGRTPQPIPPDLKQDAEKLMAEVKWEDVTDEAFEYPHKDIRYKRSHKENYWRALILGHVPRRTVVMLKKRDVTERVYGKSDGHAPGFPLPLFWWSTTETWYSLDSGEEVSWHTIWGWGPGRIFGGGAASVRPDTMASLPSFAALKGESFPYNAKRGWQILGGLVAGGSVNGQHYFQLAWIPIATGKDPVPK